MRDRFGEPRRLGWPGLPRPRRAQPQRAYFQGLGWAGGAPPGGIGGAYCPACGLKVASVATPTLRVVLFDDDELGVEAAEDVAVGLRVTLEPGFVNQRRRHVSGLPWYVRGTSPSRRSARIRCPAVVTCGCGQDVLFEGVDDATQFYATTSADRRAEQLERDHVDEANADLAEAENDRRRGK